MVLERREIVTNLWGLYVCIIVQCIISIIYLLTHPLPGDLGGLYFEMVKQVIKNGFILPETVQGYTPSGVPLAYPPLGIYVTGVIREFLSVELLNIARYLPQLLIVVTVVPLWFFYRSTVYSRSAATISTLSVISAHSIIHYHINATGIVRSWALLFTAVSLLSGYYLFTENKIRWVVFSAMAFAGVILSHPIYILFVVYSYLLMFITFDSSLTGFIHGAYVGIAGVILTSPWWMTVGSTHGFGIFVDVATARPSLGPSIVRAIRQVAFPSQSLQGNVLHIWYMLGGIGSIFAIVRRRWFVAAWPVLAAILLFGPRYIALAFGPAVGFAFREVFTVRFSSESDGRNIGISSIVLVIALVLFAILSGGLYAYTEPTMLSEETVEGMGWLKENTSENATILSSRWGNDWVPYYSNRTVSATVYGVEWRGPETYRHNREVMIGISQCWTVECIERVMSENRHHADYIYFTTRKCVNQNVCQQIQSLERSAKHSAGFEISFTNEQSLIIKSTLNSS